MEVSCERDFDANVIDKLRQIGHHVAINENEEFGFAAVTAISRVRGEIEAMYDPRRSGSVEIH